jgi:hypothetical protein
LFLPKSGPRSLFAVVRGYLVEHVIELVRCEWRKGGHPHSGSADGDFRGGRSSFGTGQRGALGGETELATEVMLREGHSRLLFVLIEVEKEKG